MKTVGKYMIRCIFAVMAGACGGDVVNSYSGYAALPEQGWAAGDVKEFAVTHRDSVCSGTLIVALRHRDEYPYKDISIAVEYSDASGAARCDTVALRLADDFGRWQGKGVGFSFQVADTVGKIVHASGGKVRLRHAMRCDTLPGISQIGVFFAAQQGAKVH